MMTSMRENMPLIMWILVIAFLATIVFSWGMGGFTSKGALDGVVGRVGGHEILYDQYNRLVQERIAQQRQQDEGRTPITDAQIKKIRQEVWDDLVRDQLMAAYQEKWGIVTSDQEVAWAVRNNPPTWIRDNESFQKDGQFDLARYEEFLKDPRSSEILVAIEKEYRSSIGNQKVIDRIISPVFVSPKEIWDEYVATNRKFQAAAVTFPLRNYPVDSTSITAEEVQKYYNDHRADYERAERRKLAYVTVPIAMTADDSNRVMETAQEVIARAQGGEDFAELARDFSEDEGSAQQGADLGYFTPGRMVKEFDSTAFATEPGKIAGPVKTRFGAHVIKVIDRKEAGDADSVHASHVLLKWKVGPDTDERAAQKAKDLQDAAKEGTLAEAAQKFGLEVKETDAFAETPTGNIPAFGAMLAVQDFAFQSKPGALSNVFRTKVRADDAYTVFQVKEVLPKGVAPLAEVESQIRQTLIREKQEQMALEAAKKFRAKIDAQNFLVAAARESLKVDTTGDHAERDFLRVFGQDENIARALLALEPGQLSNPLSNSRGAYVAVLLKKTEADTAAFEAQKAEIADRLRRTKQNQVYADWLAQAEKDVKVEDQRYLYYTDF